MKKLILIIAIALISVQAFSQGAYYVNGGKIATIDTISLSADSSFLFSMPVKTSFSAQFIWAGNDSLNAAVVPYVSNDNVHFTLYSAVNAYVTDSLSLSTAAGYGFINLPPPYKTSERYVKFVTKHGTNTTGTVYIILNSYH